MSGMSSRELDLYANVHNAERDLEMVAGLLFAASWERMVLLAIYAGPTDEWPARFDDAYMAMIRSRNAPE